MLSDQLPSIDAFANRFNTFLEGLTANFALLVVQPPWWIILLCTNH